MIMVHINNTDIKVQAFVKRCGNNPKIAVFVIDELIKDYRSFIKKLTYRNESVIDRYIARIIELREIKKNI